MGAAAGVRAVKYNFWKCIFQGRWRGQQFVGIFQTRFSDSVFFRSIFSKSVFFLKCIFWGWNNWRKMLGFSYRGRFHQNQSLCKSNVPPSNILDFWPHAKFGSLEPLVHNSLQLLLHQLNFHQSQTWHSVAFRESLCQKPNLKGGYRKFSSSSFIGPVGHNIWWENRRNGSFEPRNGPKLANF